ncbi:phosphatidylethanolamine N-methyltransferase [Xylariomycetidae sp. FL0641]|nr:phosphatidylethanolamine N-methyltransferase [Xylariomycetidae sp. FL0641]
MSATTGAPAADSADLRRRPATEHGETVGDGGRTPHSDAGNDRRETNGDDNVPKDRKTYGRTPDGTVFVVPGTKDRITQMINPSKPKNVADIIVLSVLAAHVLTLWLLPAHLKRPVFAVVYLFWRAAYNFGIGVLLHLQSHENKLVAWARKWKLFENPKTGNNPRPWLYDLLKREAATDVEGEYDFETAPIQYNTWLVFRRFVDLILMTDFVSYCLFAIACAHTPAGETLPLTIGRWVLGWALIGFNLWVKLDALRVVKDYAWYWGDFFFLVDQELTFDGVFEMAPHPMYSIGYAGYYGISMIAASYAVLFISIVAHASQFAFLVLVENPHIEKTYDPPAPRKRVETVSEAQTPPAELTTSQSSGSLDAMAAAAAAVPAVPTQTSSQVHKQIGYNNIDLFRNTDYSTMLLVLYLIALTVVTPPRPFYQALFVAHAAIWRLWYSVGLGLILRGQSNSKMWTRHFLKYGETSSEAWRQWRGMYHISQVLCHASFVAACWKLYSVPGDWSHGYVMLRHVLGASLIALQIWTAVSVYESLGEFGWFFGDFFFDRGVKLNYTSIYRFLNNPERIIGTAGLWGAALITWRTSIFVLALISHLLTLAFLTFVEQPHMQKVYGRSLRDEAGLTRVIKRSLPPPVVEWHTSVNKVMDETSHFVEDFLDTARPKLAAGVSTIVRDTTALFNKYPARLTLTRLSPDLAGLDPKHYSVTVEGETSSGSTLMERSSGKEGTAGRFPNELKTMILQYGAPIKVKWTAPANHGKKDWIGLYMVADNRSREVSELSSLGRWIATTPGQYESSIADKGVLVSDQPISSANSEVPLVSGEMVFSGDKLWWTSGVFEFRYHHDGNHNVMAISQPFEIQIGRFEDEDMDMTNGSFIYTAVEEALLPVVQNCLDRDPDIAPSTASEPWGSHVERDGKYAKRIVYAVRQMFGIEFAPAVVPADGNVKNLAWRIIHAKQALAPYSMSHSKGTTTPAEKALAI